MKKEHWRYVTIMLSVASAILLIYGIVCPGGSGINMTNTMITPNYIGNDEATTATHIFEKDISDGVSVRIIPMDAILVGGELYAEQTIVDHFAVISNDMWWGENFGFGGETHSISAFHLAVGRVGNPSEPVILGLSSLTNIFEWYKLTEFPASAFPEEGLYWVEVTLDTPLETQGVVLATATNQLLDYPNNYWMIGFAMGSNPYNLGTFVTTQPSEETVWHIGPDVNDDAAFRVYTSVPSIEPPVVYISINTYVQTAGFIALIGAALSSIKYGILAGWL